MDLIKRIKDRKPEYEASYENLISQFTLGQGGRAGTATEKTAYEQGKFFNTKYEIYMYAVLLGLKSDYKIPLKENSKRESFIEIRSWQPADLADYVVMGVIAKSNIDLLALEAKDEKEIEKEILSIRKLMEEYANGGFDKIRAKLENEPHFFENNENCFIDFLDAKNL